MTQQMLKSQATNSWCVPAMFVRIAAGIYSWLPLGVIALRNVERIIREEMDQRRISRGSLSSTSSREMPMKQQIVGKSTAHHCFVCRIAKGSDYLLGPTHEEMFTLMVKGEYSSYKDLPLEHLSNSNKVSEMKLDHAAGIIRGREFVMKDSYSFDLDDAGLEVSYQNHRDAYIKTFDRLGMKYNIVKAVSGAMGGSKSEEFLAPCSTGEDTYVLCPQVWICSKC
jgi:prolyl-tRNA synthetase